MIKYGGRERTPKEAASFITAGLIQGIRSPYGRYAATNYLDDDGEEATPEEIKALNLQLEKMVEEIAHEYTDEVAIYNAAREYTNKLEKEEWREDMDYYS